MSRVCFWNTNNNKCSIFQKDCNRQLGGEGGGRTADSSMLLHFKNCVY
jgi:hypothetical protein